MEEKRVKIKVITSSILEHPGLGRFRVKTETATPSKDRVPLDYNHNEEEVIGYVENFQCNADAITADGVVLIGDDSSDAAKTFAQNIDGGVPFEASAFLDLSEAESVELEDGVTEWSGALIRGVAICPYGTDRKTTVSLKMGETNFVVRLKKSNNEDEVMDEEKKVSIEDQKKDDSKNPREELEEMIEEFGLERGVDFFRRGVSIEEAREEDYQSLKAERLQAEEKDKTQCAATPEEEPKDKQGDSNAALKAELVKLSQEITSLKATLRRGDPDGLSGSFQREETTAQRRVLSPLAAAAEKFKRDGVKRD